ncbi:hypothetical protein [Rickettsia endosymbiont of Orchestes rusci]|uniref:hypothetical protein n=1 Tax=Rickettsia endosymbiont of Orchestes rusci TaxID=3066250 RepID=UPI00313A79A1
MIKSRHDTAFFQRSYSSGLDHVYDIELLCKNIEPRNQRHCRAGMTSKTIPTNL